MTQVDDLFASPSQAPREVETNRWGWYCLSKLPALPDGTKLKDAPRVSTLKSTLPDFYKLNQWKAAQTVIGLAMDPALLDGLYLDDDRERKELEEQARQIGETASVLAGSRRGADHGTRIHRVLEVLDKTGHLPEDVSSLEARFGHVYTATLSSKGLAVMPQYCERVVYNTELHVAGRLDRIYRDMTTGGLIIGDPKTQKWTPGEYDYIEMSTQLACYANADWMFNETTWAWEPMPTVDREHGVAVWMPAGPPRCELYGVPLEDGWTFAKAASRVRTWRKIKGFKPL